MQAYHLMLWYAGPLLFSGYAISKHSAEQYVYLKAERLEHLFKQGYSRNSSQSIRIIYRDIGLVDSAMQPDEKQPKLLPPLSEVIPFPA